jgi:cold shock CspA family protein/ribosome-associated translation inhibitor RaiA
MHTPVQITFHGVDCSDVTRGLIEEKVGWLEQLHDRIVGCRVVVEMPHKHHRQGNTYHVRIDLKLPGTEIIVNREPGRKADSTDLHAVISRAFDAARRQLEEHTRRRRQEVKIHESTPYARVTRLFAEEGYGFLMTADNREVYFHQNAVVNGGFQQLEVGSEVTFAEVPGEKGPQASTVRLVGRHNHH